MWRGSLWLSCRRVAMVALTQNFHNGLFATYHPKLLSQFDQCVFSIGVIINSMDVKNQELAKKSTIRDENQVLMVVVDTREVTRGSS